MKKRTRKVMIISVIVVAVFVVSGAVAIAASNISEIEELYLAFRTAQVESSVEKGDMTQDQADEYLSNLSEQLEEDEEDAVPPLRGGQNGRKGQKGPNALEIYAELSGTSADDLKDACKDGETTLFAMADEAGMLDELKAAMIENAYAKIDGLLEDGKITEEKAVEMKAESAEAINAITADTQPPVRPQGQQRPANGQGTGRRSCTE